MSYLRTFKNADRVSEYLPAVRKWGLSKQGIGEPLSTQIMMDLKNLTHPSWPLRPVCCVREEGVSLSLSWPCPSTNDHDFSHHSLEAQLSSTHSQPHDGHAWLLLNLGYCPILVVPQYPRLFL